MYVQYIQRNRLSLSFPWGTDRENVGAQFAGTSLAPPRQQGPPEPSDQPDRRPPCPNTVRRSGAPYLRDDDPRPSDAITDDHDGLSPGCLSPLDSSILLRLCILLLCFARKHAPALLSLLLVSVAWVGELRDLCVAAVLLFLLASCSFFYRSKRCCIDSVVISITGSCFVFVRKRALRCAASRLLALRRFHASVELCCCWLISERGPSAKFPLHCRLVVFRYWIRFVFFVSSISVFVLCELVCGLEQCITSLEVFALKVCYLWSWCGLSGFLAVASSIFLHRFSALSKKLRLWNSTLSCPHLEYLHPCKTS